jgi:hypothetical protein
VAIAVDCPHCGKAMRLKEELAGRKGKCPQCEKTFEIPRPSGDPTPRPAAQNPEHVREQVQAGFHGKLTLPPVSIVRKGAALIVLAIILLMPLFYAAVIGGLAYGMWWLASSSFGRELAPAVFWVAEIFAGLVLVCLIKPLVEPQRRAVEVHPIDLNRESLLHDFVAQVCEQVGAQPPKTIGVECSPRLTARGRRGGSLTLGLPLVACLSVQQLACLIAGQMALLRGGAACGVTNTIGGINGWLWHSVYGRSRFDRWLALVAERPHFHLAKLLLPLAGAKFVAQIVLFVPMFVANTVSAAVVRQAELDADRCAVRLVGRKAFAAVLERVELVEFTWEGVVAELAFLHTEQQLPDGLPQQLALRMLDMTPELGMALRETVNRPDEKPFDSRASAPERLDSVANEPAQGVFECPLPAKALLSGYDELGRKITWDYYSGRFGAQLLKTALKPVIALP